MKKILFVLIMSLSFLYAKDVTKRVGDWTLRFNDLNKGCEISAGYISESYDKDLYMLDTDKVLFVSDIKTVSADIKPSEIKKLVDSNQYDLMQNIIYFTKTYGSCVAFYKGNKYYIVAYRWSNNISYWSILYK